LKNQGHADDIILASFEIQGHVNPDFYPKIPHFCQFKGMHGMQGMQAKTPLPQKPKPKSKDAY